MDKQRWWKTPLARKPPPPPRGESASFRAGVGPLALGRAAVGTGPVPFAGRGYFPPPLTSSESPGRTALETLCPGLTAGHRGPGTEVTNDTQPLSSAAEELRKLG